MKRKMKVLLLTLAAAIVAGGATGLWVWKKRGPVLREVALDLKAGARARGAEVPFDRFIELRYGPMSDPTNRQKAFAGFFDPAHMEGMYRLVGFMKEGERRANIQASAQWIAKYRETMSEAEKKALAEWMRSPETRATLQRASGLYRSRDIQYRSATESVIKELMTTLASVSNEP